MNPSRPPSADVPALVWYAGYGSNLDRRRFACYLGGGTPPGASRVYPGCRDRTPPRAERGVRLPGEVYFAWESPTWGGGVAFLRPDPAEVAYARAYLISGDQFADIVAQEMHRDPGPALDLAGLGGETGTLTLGPGRYETLCRVGTIDALPVLTFTASWEHRGVRRIAPAAAYLNTLSAGLRHTFGWSARQIANYLVGRPGVVPGWDLGSLTELAARTEPRPGPGQLS